MTQTHYLEREGPELFNGPIHLNTFSPLDEIGKEKHDPLKDIKIYHAINGNSTEYRFVFGKTYMLLSTSKDSLSFTYTTKPFDYLGKKMSLKRFIDSVLGERKKIYSPELFKGAPEMIKVLFSLSEMANTEFWKRLHVEQSGKKCLSKSKNTGSKKKSKPIKKDKRKNIVSLKKFSKHFRKNMIEETHLKQKK